MTSILFLAEWALRSSILVVSGALVLGVLRVKDPSIRWAAWTAILVGSLMLPVMTAVLPRVPLTIVRAESAPVGAMSAPGVVDDTLSQNEPAITVQAAKAKHFAPPTPFNWARAGVVLYGLIAFGLLLRLCIGLVISRRLLRRTRTTGLTLDAIDVRESDGLQSPVTLGIIRPVIALPADWRSWSQESLDAVLAHEKAHIRRFDPAVQLLCRIHRSLLWFSPASWFLDSRIVRLAEDASDDAAVAATSDRATYAELLLGFVQRGARTPHWYGVPMARHGHVDSRIHRILDGTTLSRGITRWSVAAIVVLGSPLAWVVASAYPKAGTPPVLSAPAVHETQIAKPAATIVDKLRFERVLVAQAEVPPKVQSPPAERPKFDVASIRPCDPATQVRGRGGKSAGSTARYRRNCVTVKTLIENAYVRFADGNNRSPTLTQLTKIEGGPTWIDADQYTIDAEADGDFPPMKMDGPMMQALLEDRFQLKIHREAREGPVYELTPARGGARVQPAKQGPCLPSDFRDSPFPPFQAPPEMANVQCSFSWGVRKGPNVIRAARSATMAEFTASLTGTMGRLVVDKTGITVPVDFRLVYSPDESTPGAQTPEQAEQVARINAEVFGIVPKIGDAESVGPDPAGPSIFTALEQQLGLKLVQARGSREYLVIDSISRPSPN